MIALFALYIWSAKGFCGVVVERLVIPIASLCILADSHKLVVTMNFFFKLEKVIPEMPIDMADH